MNFNSIYATHISEYIKFKRNLGFSLRDVEYVFIQFDRLAIQRGESKVGITKELSDAWCAKRPNELEGTRYDRVSKLSLFARYLCNMGYPSYIPEIPKFKSSFIPYVFSKEEIRLIIEASDRYCAEKQMSDSYSMVLPVLLRVLYGTGLRIGEAIGVLSKDVNLKEKHITIRQSKNGTERIVPLSESVTDTCRQYLDLKKTGIRGRMDTELFFVKDNNTCCKSSSIYATFRKILRLAGISHRGKGLGPRVHDLRHTFACHSLAQMIASGLDVYQSIPLLSTCLGHRTIESTEKYVRLTSEIYPGLLKEVESVCEFVFPRLKTIADETH